MWLGGQTPKVTPSSARIALASLGELLVLVATGVLIEMPTGRVIIWGIIAGVPLALAMLRAPRFALPLFVVMSILFANVLLSSPVGSERTTHLAVAIAYWEYLLIAVVVGGVLTLAGRYLTDKGDGDVGTT